MVIYINIMVSVCTLFTTMNLIFAFVFNLYISLSSCRSVKYVEDDAIKDILAKQLSPTGTDNQKSFLNKLKFLKVLPLNKEWENTPEIHGHPLKSETKNKNSVPIAIIIAAPDSLLEKDNHSESNTTIVENEERMAAGEESNDISNIIVEDNESNVKSKLNKDEKFGSPPDNIEEKTGETLEAETNTDPNESLRNDHELKSIKPKIEDEANIKMQMENVTIQDEDTETRRVIPDISKAYIGSEEQLHHMHSMLEVKKDPKGTTVVKETNCKQSGSCHESDVNDDDPNTIRISYSLNKYIYLK